MSEGGASMPSSRLRAAGGIFEDAELSSRDPLIDHVDAILGASDGAYEWISYSVVNCKCSIE